MTHRPNEESQALLDGNSLETSVAPTAVTAAILSEMKRLVACLLNDILHPTGMHNRYLTDRRSVYQNLVFHLVFPINVLKTAAFAVTPNYFRQVYTDPLSLESRGL
jgi:hypothetical protein